MIIVRLCGGLGNQMFQYAAARRLALANDAPLKLDLSWFEGLSGSDTRRSYELHVFNSVQQAASPREVARLRGIDTGKWPKLAKRFIGATGIFKKGTYVREKHYHFDAGIMQLRGDFYLDGYWQSEKFFRDAAATIRQDFRFGCSPDATNGRVAETIAACEAVSLHVRRGDYVSNPATNQYHGCSSLEYYRAALERMKAAVRQPHLFIFSDDPDWVKEHLRFDLPTTFVDHNGPEKAYEDMRLMSLCRHHIIANSSFSWWGAWLSSNAAKVVIAPKRWFNDACIDTGDVTPEGWARL